MSVQVPFWDDLASCSEAEEECKMALFGLLSKSELFDSQLEIQVYIIFFPRKTGDGFQSAVCAVPWWWQPPKTVFLIVAVPWDSGLQTPGTRAR